MNAGKIMNSWRMLNFFKRINATMPDKQSKITEVLTEEGIRDA
jgi:hypothetical protein